jgi:hypothetical protein
VVAAGSAAGALLVAGLIVSFDIPGVETMTAPLASPGARPARSAIPVVLQREARPIGRGWRFEPGAPAHVTGRCGPALGGRFPIHLELFAANRVILIPAGIGVGRPWQTDEGRIASGRCYGRFVTTDPTGVVWVAPGRGATLRDLFAAWGRRLTSRRLLSFPGRVRVYANGRSVAIAPGRLTLRRDEEIVLEVGPKVPPHRSYAFPPALGPGE